MTAPAASETAREIRVREAAVIVDYLERNPVDRELILIAARLDREPETLAFEGRTGVDRESVEARRRMVERHIDAGFFGACSTCFQPIVSFPDGGRVDWPAGFDTHECARPTSPTAAPPPAARTESAPAGHRGFPPGRPVGGVR